MNAVEVLRDRLHSDAGPGIEALDRLARLVAAVPAFKRKFDEVAARATDRSCDYDVCKEVRDITHAMADVLGEEE
jgi:hypothetical protein